MEFIGRESELNLLKSCTESDRAELGVVYGRRRVGKSELLKKLVKRKGDYYFEGLQKTSAKNQIAHFIDQLAEQTGTLRALARDWKEAFQALSVHIVKG